MTPAEQLHLDAAAYANKRLAMHKEAIKQQKQTDEQVHGGNWVAHYEGYVAGYEAKRTGLTDEQKQMAIWIDGTFGSGALWAEKQIMENT